MLKDIFKSAIYSA